MAGLIAGARTGVAPGAHLVSVKIAGADGTTTLSRVIEGLALVDTVRDSLDVDVLLVALSAPAHDGRDPLEIALEQLWARGLTVVVPAGNEGDHVGTPGSAPHVITVGALDDAGTAAVADDTIPDWSSHGGRARAADKPELVAPGVSVVSLRAEGTTLDADHPQARVGDSYFRGSGTSMSAALTAGAAATVLGASAGLSPDGVKGQLLDGAAPAPAGAAPARGVLDVPGAIAAPPVTGNGHHAAVPGLDRVHGPVGLPGAAPADVAPGHAEAVDVTGWRWAEGEWTGWRWAGWRWAGWRWAGWRWSGWRWSGWRWSGWRWSAVMYGAAA
jgi:serine protease AprX